MHQNAEFANFILSDRNYAAYPEVLEFYTGIDRRRDDALLVLAADLADLLDTVVDDTGLPESLDPYEHASWQPTPASLESLHDELNQGVSKSNLPDVVKDHFADKLYDPTRPYHQEISSILSEQNLVLMGCVMRAATRALRNSDYADVDVKKKILKLVMKGWEHLLKIVLVLAPILAQKGHVFYEGYGFFLVDQDFDGNDEDRFYGILSCLPQNIVNWYSDDLYSKKIGPLLISELEDDSSRIRQHNLILLIVARRPKGWQKIVRHYITMADKNSWYLLDVHCALQVEYKFGFAAVPALNDIGDLIKMTLIKHQFGAKSPSAKSISKVPDNVLPKRKSD